MGLGVGGHNTTGSYWPVSNNMADWKPFTLAQTSLKGQGLFG